MVFNATLNNISVTVFPTVNWSWMEIRSSKGVRITGPSIKFKGHSHTPQRGCSDLYWSFGSVMNNLLLDQTIFYRTLPHVWWTLGITKVISLWWDLLVEEISAQRKPLTFRKSLTTLSHNVVLSTPCLIGINNIDSYKSNYHTITTTTAPSNLVKL